ncbi:MAG: carboxypeptidase-like regulatory domain-containing protein, partial [Patescibacteria group bacterium]|nr:carboxypeptidase-like regulatory domain-containing protein [Patescibacteria group bacterium]
TEARRLNYVYLAPNSRNYYKNIDSGTANFRIWGWDQYFTPFAAGDLDYQSALLDSRIGSINSSNASWILPVETSDNYGCYPDKIKGTAVYKNVAKSGYASINIFSSFESTQKTSFFDWFASYVKAAVTEERTPVAISTGARTTFRPGESHKFVAIMVDQYGQVMEDTQFVFSLNDPQAGSLMPNGQFIASDREGTYQNAMTVKGIWNGVEKTSSYTLKISSATRKATTVKYVGPKDLGATKILKIAPNEPYSVEAYLYDQFGDRIVSENGVRLTKIISNAALEVSERNIIANSGTDFYQNAVKLSFEWADWADPDKHVDGPSPELIFSVEVNEKYANDPKSCLGGGDDGKGTEGTDEDKNVIDIVKDIWNALKRTIGRFLDALTTNPLVSAAVAILASAPILVGAISTLWPNLASVLLATGAASTRTGFRFPVYATVGRKKGYVYDVLNKMPIAGVLIRVFDLGSDRLIYQTATNQQGEFIIKLPKGRFYIETKKEGYKNVKFVSHVRDQKAKLNLTDGYYNNIYFSEQVIEIGKQQKPAVENMSIPMQKSDSLKGISTAKKVLIKIWGFLRILSVPLLLLGTILVIYSLVRDSNLVLNYFVAGYYLLLWIWQLFLLSIFVKGPGQVVDGSGKPLDLVLVRAIDEKGRLINTTVSNKEGKFILNLSKGKYSLTFRKPGFAQKALKITVKSLADLKKLKIKLQEKKE